MRASSRERPHTCRRASGTWLPAPREWRQGCNSFLCGDGGCNGPGGQGHQPQLLSIWWRVAYWYGFTVQFTLLPFHQEYADCGAFTVADRIATSLRNNLIFYAILLVLEKPLPPQPPQAVQLVRKQ